MSTPNIPGLSSTGLKALRIPNKDPQQMDILRQLGMNSGQNISSVLGQWQKLAGGGSEQDWQQLEAPALRQFGELQGGLASRFSGMGSGARKSSGFQNASSGAADLSERLQSQRMGLQQGAQDRLMQLYQMLLGQDTFDTALAPKKKSGWEQFIGGIAPGLGSFASGAGNLGIAKSMGLF